MSSIETFVYDVECYPNFFEVSFIPLTVDVKYIKAYIKADMAGNKEDKKALLKAMQARTFMIFKGEGKDTYSKNDTVLLADFMSRYKILYGYNSYGYDSLMMDIFLHHYKMFYKDGYNKEGVHITKFLNTYSKQIIDYGKGFRWTLEFYRYYKRPYTDRDIQKILYLDKSFTGLKKVAINLKWYRIQELPISPYKIIHSSQIFDVTDYNINDVLITHALIIDQKDELEIRDVGSAEFKIDLTNMSRSSIGKALVTKYYNMLTGIAIKDFIYTKTNRFVIRVASIIDRRIKFKTPEFNKLYKDIVSSTIYITKNDDKSSWGFSLLYNGTKYIVAKGGLHSKDDPRVFEILTKLNMLMRDADVTSFYPKNILNLRISPKHLIAKAFLTIVDYVMTARVKAKHEFTAIAKSNPKMSAMLKKKAEIYKIAINRMYGAFKDAFDYLYDPECTYKTTINGQLYLLMLVEELEINGIHVISANTDGIVALFDKSLESEYKRICSEWEKSLDFELEYTDYEKYIRFNVNNYIAIKKGFYADHEIAKVSKKDTPESRKELEKKYIKRKGLFIEKPDFSMGFINPVVNMALSNFYIYETPITEFLKKHAKKQDGIYDFCITQRVDKKFQLEWHKIVDGLLVKDVLQQYVRFYVSSKNTGNILKFNPETKKYTSIVANQNLQLLNVYRGEIITDINFSYYIKECNKVIYGQKNSAGISTLLLDFDFGKTNNEIIKIDTDEYSYLFDSNSDMLDDVNINNSNQVSDLFDQKEYEDIDFSNDIYTDDLPF